MVLPCPGSGSADGEHAPRSPHTIQAIYDNQRRLRAISGEASDSDQGFAGWKSILHGESSFESEAGSTFDEWLAQQISRSEQNRGYQGESSIEHAGEIFQISFNSVSSAEGLFGYVVNVHRPCVEASEEGSSVVTRQQWHDIKNQLGGLKLYATFLHKKLSGKEDQAVAEKLLTGINGLISHLARIRRGE